MELQQSAFLKFYIKDIKILTELFPHLIKKENNTIFFKDYVIEILEVIEA